MIPAQKQEQPPPSTIEAVLIKGDLSRLTEQQRLQYYKSVCELVGLNPLTKPFDYLTLNGKLVLYPNKSCAEQLRKIHEISLEIVSQDLNADGLFTVHARAKDKSGRADEDLGVVTLGQLRSGETVANMILKAITKAKRRVTLSICGLGFLDTEGDDAPREGRRPLRLYPPDKEPSESAQDEQNEETETISQEQVAEIIAFAESTGAKLLDICARFEVSKLADLPVEKYPMVLEAIEDYERRKSQRSKIESGPRK